MVKGQDLVTLMTCTPIGINNRRLLVRGHRVKRHKEETQSDNLNNRNPLIGVFLIMTLLGMIIIEVMRYRQKNSVSHLCCNDGHHR